MRKLGEFLAEPQVGIHATTLRIAEIYGEFVSALQQQGTPIPTNDIWIAAAAFECRGRLVSGDVLFRHLTLLDRVEV